jgi:hypothetical protein
MDELSLLPQLGADLGVITGERRYQRSALRLNDNSLAVLERDAEAVHELSTHNRLVCKDGY